MAEGETQRTALAVVLVFAFLLAAYVTAPLWVGLMLGTVMAFTTQPLYVRLSARLGERKGIAAAIVTVASGIVAAAICVLALYVVTDELVSVVRIVQSHASGRTLGEVIGPRAAHALERMGVSQEAFVARLHQELNAAASSLAQAAGVAAQTVTHALLGLLLALITMYYVLIEWPRATRRLEVILPLHPAHTRALMAELRDVGRGTLVGTVATAVVQGVIAWLGYLIGGVPQAATWATLTAIASFIPLVGTTVVWIPIGIYVIYIGRPAAGIFELAWGVLVVTTLSDYVIRPRIIGKTGHGHPLLMLVGILGGLEAMGLAGLIVGPILMSFFVAVLRIYEREAAHHAASQ